MNNAAKYTCDGQPASYASGSSVYSYSAKGGRPSGFLPRAQSRDMAEQCRNPYNHRRVEPLQGDAEFLGRELLVLRAVQIQVQPGRIVCCLDVVDLLGRSVYIPIPIPLKKECVPC